MDFRRQRYFLAVAQNGGFRKAAEILHVSQSALSQQIQALEQDLGIELFERRGRNVQLTPAGEEYCHGVEATLADMQHWVRRARDVQEGWKNCLTIGVNPMMMLSSLPPIISAFRKAHQNVRINITITPPPEVLMQLRDGRVDLALTGYGVGDEDVVAEALWTFPVKLALPIDHPQAKNDIIDLRMLAGETIFVPARPSNSMGAAAVRELCKAKSLPAYDIHEVVGDKPSLTIMGLLSCGHGFAFLSSAYRHVLPSRIVFRDAVQLNNTVTVAACFRRNDDNPLIGEFMGFARRLAASTLD